MPVGIRWFIVAGAGDDLRSGVKKAPRNDKPPGKAAGVVVFIGRLGRGRLRHIVLSEAGELGLLRANLRAVLSYVPVYGHDG